MTNPDTKTPRCNIKTATLRRLRRRTADFDLASFDSVAVWQSPLIPAAQNALENAMRIGAWSRMSESNATRIYGVTECLGGTQ